MGRHELDGWMRRRGQGSVGCDAGRMAGLTVPKVDDHMEIRRTLGGPLSEADRGK